MIKMDTKNIPPELIEKFRMKICKLHPDATVPTKAHENDLGWDLHCLEDITISAQNRAVIRTGIAIGFPENVGGMVKDRSGVASKQGLYVHAGVIDPDYTGEIQIVMFNSTTTDVTVRKGAKIAQLLLLPVFFVTEVQLVGNLEDTKRCDAGFGSTGDQNGKNSYQQTVEPVMDMF